MSVTYSAAVKTARMQAVRDAINAGAGPGVLQIGTAAMASVLASIPLTDPVTVSGAVLTALAAPATVAASAAGTAAAARIRDSDGNDIVTGLTVGTSAADVIVDNTNIANGQNVTANSATITHG